MNKVNHFELEGFGMKYMQTIFESMTLHNKISYIVTESSQSTTYKWTLRKKKKLLKEWEKCVASYFIAFRKKNSTQIWVMLEYFSFKDKLLWANQMTQQITVLAIHTWQPPGSGRQNWRHKAILWHSHVCCGTHVHKRTLIVKTRFKEDMTLDIVQ